MLIARPMNMKTPSMVAMVLLLNKSRDNNGCGALYVRAWKEGTAERIAPIYWGEGKGTVTTHFYMHSQITRLYL